MAYSTSPSGEDGPADGAVDGPTQSLRYVPTAAEVAYSAPDAYGRSRPVVWGVPVPRRPVHPRFCEVHDGRAPADHEWVQWYTEAGRRMFRVLTRCDAHAPEIVIDDAAYEDGVR